MLESTKPGLKEAETFTKEVVISLSTPSGKLKHLLPTLYRIFGTIPLPNREDTKITYFLKGDAAKISDDYIKSVIHGTIGVHVTGVEIAQKDTKSDFNFIQGK